MDLFRSELGPTSNFFFQNFATTYSFRGAIKLHDDLREINVSTYPYLSTRRRNKLQKANTLEVRHISENHKKLKTKHDNLI